MPKTGVDIAKLEDLLPALSVPQVEDPTLQSGGAGIPPSLYDLVLPQTANAPPEVFRRNAGDEIIKGIVGNQFPEVGMADRRAAGLRALTEFAGNLGQLIGSHGREGGKGLVSGPMDKLNELLKGAQAGNLQQELLQRQRKVEGRADEKYNEEQAGKKASIEAAGVAVGTLQGFITDIDIQISEMRQNNPDDPSIRRAEEKKADLKRYLQSIKKFSDLNVPPPENLLDNAYKTRDELIALTKTRDEWQAEQEILVERSIDGYMANNPGVSREKAAAAVAERFNLGYQKELAELAKIRSETGYYDARSKEAAADAAQTKKFADMSPEDIAAWEAEHPGWRLPPGGGKPVQDMRPYREPVADKPNRIARQEAVKELIGESIIGQILAVGSGSVPPRLIGSLEVLGIRPVENTDKGGRKSYVLSKEDVDRLREEISIAPLGPRSRPVDVGPSASPESPGSSAGGYTEAQRQQIQNARAQYPDWTKGKTDQEIEGQIRRSGKWPER